MRTFLPRRLAPASAPRIRRLRQFAHGLVVVGFAATVLAAGGAFAFDARPGYDAEATLALAVPPRDGQNIYYAKLDTTGVSNVVYAVVTDERVRDRLAAEGYGGYQVAIGSGSLAPHTDVLGYGDVLRVGAIADDAGHARATVDAVIDQVQATLDELQGDPRIPDVLKVAVVESSAPQVAVLTAHLPIGIAGAAGLALLLALPVSTALRARRARSALQASA
jgi:hypothetical protein